MAATKERLHKLVEILSDTAVVSATGYLEKLVKSDPVSRALAEALPDDEPDNDDLDGGLSRARKEAHRGESIPTKELRHRLDLE